MSTSTIATIIAFSYGGLLVLWLLTLPFARRAFSRQAVILEPKSESAAPNRARLWVSSGTLSVFLFNILSMGLFICAAIWPALEGFLGRWRIPIPISVQATGAIFFILNGIWGLLVLVFNPAYTPFFLKRKESILLATKGPYAFIRHPRYASEAALNIILFLFTGTWISLLGILGWTALRRQAIAEEEFLLGIAPEAYERYRSSSGRFLPRWKFRKEE
jgi:protein-S-isoprenylcysteine O-methyltransferase Ste14